MAISSEEIIIKGISHEIRREILQLVINDPRSFTDLLNHFDISTGKLNYHLTLLKGFIKKNTDSSLYEITSLGQKALNVLDTIHDFENTQNNQILVKEAFLAQKNVGKPLILHGITIMLVLLSLFLIIHGSMIIGFLLIFKELNEAIIVLPILMIIIAIELASFYWLLKIRRSAPIFIERLNKHLQDDS